MTSNDDNSIFVHAWLDGRYVPAGKLMQTSRGYEFWYGNSFLKNGYALDPTRLPLTEKIFFESSLQGVLGVFGDALPDSWGRYLIKRENGALNNIELLTIDASTQRMGGLFFSRELNSKPVATSHDFGWMKQFSAWLCDHTLKFPAHTEYGSSAGGAKPKCLVKYQNKEWIAKFQPSNGELNKPAIEHGTLALAKSCGIPCPESRLIDLPNQQQAVLIERFDRYNDTPLHYLSAKTACEVLEDERGSVINDNRSYLILADQISKLSIRPEEDRKDLFNRISFNIFIGNHDDHVKNHGFIRSADGNWSLSPAFDLLMGEGERRDMAMSIGLEGNKASFSNLLSSVESFGLTRSEGIARIRDMEAQLAEWKNLLKKEGIDSRTIDDIKWVFEVPTDVSRLAE